MPPEDLQAISTPEPSSRRDQLAALLDAAPEGPIAESAVAEPEPAPEPEPVAEGQPRAADGKFVAAEPVAAAPAPSEPEAPAPVAEEPLWKRPPASWGKTDHEKWITAAGNPETAPFVQKAWEREEEMRRGVEPLIPKAKFADEMYRAIEPYQANQRAAGVEPVQAMSALMQADDILRNAPRDQAKAYALSLLAQYGIQLTPDDAYVQVQTPPPGYIPQAAVQNLVDQRLTSWQEQQQAEVLQADIDAFKKDKPDFEALRPYMKMLLENELVPDLAAAYEKAKRLDDTSFAGLQAAHQAQADSDKRKAADNAAKSARAAAVSARSSSPGAPAPTKAQDRRSMLASQLDEAEHRF